MRIDSLKCICACLSCAVMIGCRRQDMYNQAKLEPLEASAFFADGRSARPPVPGTVARGQLQADVHYYTGRSGGELADTFPMPVTYPMLQRGQQRYNIFCANCHDRTGSGKGMIVRRGFRAPPSFHEQRLREARPGHFFDVITNGFGSMYSYGEHVSVDDRWAIIAYIRALQLSQGATLEDVPDEQRTRLEGIKQ